jgi:hypothetical protein
MSYNKKDERNRCRERIVEHALQIVRLETMGVSLDDQYCVRMHCHSDVQNQVEGHLILMRREARVLLALLTADGEVKEETDEVQ